MGEVNETKDPVNKGVSEGYECIDGTEDKPVYGLGPKLVDEALEANSVPPDLSVTTRGRPKASPIVYCSVIAGYVSSETAPSSSSFPSFTS